MRNGYRVIDMDSHVTPSMEVLHKYASKSFRERWSDFDPYLRQMNSPPGRGHPTTPWNTLKVRPIPYNRIAGQSLERLSALSDGLFAFAMTLLVLDIRVPAMEAIHSESDLWRALLGLAPRIGMYLMSFLTLGIFWLGRQTGSIDDVNFTTGD